LVVDRDRATREAVAGNPAVPEDVLITMLADRHWRVRLTAAGNPAATVAARRAMCVAADSDIRLALAQRPGLPPLAQLSGIGELPADASVQDLVGYIRKRDAIIVCCATTVTVDEPADPKPGTTAPGLPAPKPRATPATSERQSQGRAAPGQLARFVTGVNARWRLRTPPPPSRKRE
jgi:hypothetical protein